MPLIKRIVEKEAELTLLLWQIDESVDELFVRAGLTEEEKRRYAVFTGESRKKEWLAVRVLLRETFGGGVGIGYDEKGAPYPLGKQGAVSVSHTTGYAAVFCAPYSCGVDIESVTRDFEKVAGKYVAETEYEWVSRLAAIYGMNTAYGIVWCVKEALFKAGEKERVDFKKDMELINLYEPVNVIAARLFDEEYLLRFRISDNLILVYSISQKK